MSLGRGEIKEGRSWEEWYEKELIGMGRFVYGLFRSKGIDAMRIASVLWAITAVHKIMNFN